MRELIVPTIAVLFSLTGICRAQLIKSYGLKVAFTSASQNISYPFDALGWWTSSRVSPQPGFNVAAFAEWLNFPFFSVISQIEYDQRGTKLEYFVRGDSGPIAKASTNGRLDYLSLPILAKITILNGPLSPYLIAGPRVDFIAGHNDVEIQPNMYPLYSNFRNTMLGWSMGVGLQTGSLLPVTLLAELRYNVDFFDSYNNDNVRIRNNALDVWLGVAL
ncbi:MAG: PorT family protein [Bacteroidetes bacterium]|nr:PorT family protein [Bacteroidota bacterium]MCL5737785.1 PorT family protein [Bacteroidota bacterium]